MQLSVVPLGNRGFLDNRIFARYCIHLVSEKGVICQLTTDGAILDGDKKTLLEIQHELKDFSIGFAPEFKIESQLKL